EKKPKRSTRSVPARTWSDWRKRSPPPSRRNIAPAKPRRRTKNQSRPKSRRNPSASRRKSPRRSNLVGPLRAVMSRSFSRHQIRLLISAVLLSILAACGGPSREIVGKWRTSSDPNSVVWEFADNGLVLIGSTRGRYRFRDSDRVKLETQFGILVC